MKKDPTKGNNMSKKTGLAFTLLALAGLASFTTAHAQETDKLKATGCLGCHDLEKKKVGPPLKEAAKKGLKAEDLVAKMKEGKGHPKQNKPESDLKAAVDQALATK
jgi:cytochrome c551/c552